MSGDGIPLFLNENPEIKLKLIEIKNTGGMVELSYVRRQFALAYDIKQFRHIILRLFNKFNHKIIKLQTTLFIYNQCSL